MEIVSLRSQDEPFSLNDIFTVPGAVRSIIAISAYIDIDSIKELVKFLSDSADSRGKPSLKIYIDKSSSRFFSDRKTKNGLLKQQKEILERFSNDSGIFLVQFGKLFHSKIYLIEANRIGKIVLGSMNLTQKGVNENEEILLIDNYKIDGRAISNRLSKWVKEYSESLNAKSTCVAENITGNYPSCMRQFLLNGSIYYELKEQNPFRFKLNLPEVIIKQKAQIDHLLESSITDTISIEALIYEIRESTGKTLPSIGKTKAFWKKYCVETCYGFWNPDLWNEEITATLKTRIEERKPYYDEIKLITQDNGREIKSSFIQLCERIQIYLVKNYSIKDWEYGESKNAIEAWDKWYKNLISKLGNEDFYNRLISGISFVPSPDVWNDSLSSAEFENSFYQSIIYYWSKEYSKETTNVIAQAIARNIGIGTDEKNEMDIDKLKNTMEKWLLESPELSIVDFNEEENR